MSRNEQRENEPGWERRRLMAERGSISGSGKAIPDDEALALLDERIEPFSAVVPDLEVLVEPALDTQGDALRELRPSEPLWQRYIEAIEETQAKQVAPKVLAASDTDLLLHSLVPRWADYLSRPRPFRMRLLVEDTPLDFNLSEDELTDPKLTLEDLLSTHHE